MRQHSQRSTLGINRHRCQQHHRTGSIAGDYRTATPHSRLCAGCRRNDHDVRPFGINPNRGSEHQSRGSIVGHYVDNNNTVHGFVRAATERSRRSTLRDQSKPRPQHQWQGSIAGYYESDQPHGFVRAAMERSRRSTLRDQSKPRPSASIAGARSRDTTWTATAQLTALCGLPMERSRRSTRRDQSPPLPQHQSQGSITGFYEDSYTSAASERACWSRLADRDTITGDSDHFVIIHQASPYKAVSCACCPRYSAIEPALMLMGNRWMIRRVERRDQFHRQARDKP